MRSNSRMMVSASLLPRTSRLLLLRFAGALLRALRRPPPAGAPRRVLVIKPDNLGDIVLLTPALRLLRSRLPHAQLVLMIGPWGRPAIAHNPDVDAVLVFPFPGFERAARSGRPGRAADVFGLLRPYILLLKTALLLRAGRFDIAVIARDDHWWGALLAAAAGIPRIAGYAVAEVAPFLTDTLPHSYADHATAQAIGLVEALTGMPALTRPALRSPSGEADHAWAHDWIERSGVNGRPLFAIHPGAGGAAKLWLPARWVAVANALHDIGDVLLTAGPDERELVSALAGRMERRPLLLDGQATLGQLAALYARCELVLGVDSGPLHLAAASGARTVALFGPGDAGRFGPWGDPERNTVVRSGLWCSPCGVIDVCPRGTAPSECMALISVSDVLQAALAPMSNEQLL